MISLRFIQLVPTYASGVLRLKFQLQHPEPEGYRMLPLKLEPKSVGFSKYYLKLCA